MNPSEPTGQQQQHSTSGPMPQEVENKFTEYLMNIGSPIENRKYLRHGARWGYALLVADVETYKEDARLLKAQRIHDMEEIKRLKEALGKALKLSQNTTHPDADYLLEEIEDVIKTALNGKA